MAFKGEGKRCKENTIDDILDDEWSYDFENDIDSDEEHVDSIQWCATFSSHGAGLNVGFNHGGDLDADLNHGISGLEVGLDHGTSDLDVSFDDGGAFDDGDALDDGAIALDDGVVALDDGAIALDDGLDHDYTPDDRLNRGAAIKDGLDHGATNPSKSKGDLWNINNLKLLVPKFKAHNNKFEPRFVTP